MLPNRVLVPGIYNSPSGEIIGIFIEREREREIFMLNITHYLNIVHNTFKYLNNISSTNESGLW